MAAEASEKGVSGEEEKNTIAQIWKLWFKISRLCNFVKVAKFCHFVWFGLVRKALNPTQSISTY